MRSTSSRGQATFAPSATPAQAAPEAEGNKPHVAPRIGLLGGTFDPPHYGHLRLAEAALAQLGLEQVLLTPLHTPPHKPLQAASASPAHRLQMCKLATEPLHGVGVCALEVERGGASYTVDTLEAIHDEQEDARLTFIAGADIVLSLSSWRQPSRLLELADLAVAERQDANKQRVEQALAPFGGKAQRLRFVAMPPVAVSSSLVRRRVASGKPIDELVPAPVAAYIAEHGLYRQAVA